MKLLRDDFQLPRIRLSTKRRSMWNKIQIGLDVYMVFWWTTLAIAHATTGYKIEHTDLVLLFISTIWLWVWFLIEDLTGRR